MPSRVVEDFESHLKVRSSERKAFLINCTALILIAVVFLSALLVAPIAYAREASAAGRASATVIEPVSAFATRGLTIGSEECAKPPISEHCTGEIILRGAGAFAFSLNVLRAPADFSSDQQIKVQGSNNLAGVNWLDDEGASVISLSGAPSLERRSQYESMIDKVLIQVSYN